MICDVPPQPLDEGESSLLTPQFAVVMLASFAYFIAIGALIPTVPRFVEGELGGDGLAVGIGVGSMAVTAAALRPWVGRMGDTHGRRVLAVGGALVVAVSILGYAVARRCGCWWWPDWSPAPARPPCSSGSDRRPGPGARPPPRRGGVVLLGGALRRAGGGAAHRRGPRWPRLRHLWVALAASSGLAALASMWIRAGHTVAAARGRGFLQRDAVWPGFILFLGLIPFTAFSSFVPLYAEDLGQSSVGAVFGLYAGLVLIVRIVGARLPDRLGWRRGSSIALCGVTVGVWLVAGWGSMASIWLGRWRSPWACRSCTRRCSRP